MSDEPIAADPITVEVMSFRPCIREDLRVTRQVHSGLPSFVIEDPVSGRFSRVGNVEYTFLSQLDGRTTVAEAFAVTASKHGLDALDEQDAVSLCGWLVESGLAHTNASKTGRRVADVARKQREQVIVGAMNPMFQKIPLCNPSFMVDPMVRVAKRLSQRSMVRVVLMFTAALGFAATTLALIGNWHDLWNASRNVFADGNWIWLIATWVIVKGIHELGHATACRWLGGRVGEAGVMLVLFMPLPYVDVSSSWAFPNKWHRMLVAGAGMMVEAAMASIAFWFWLCVEDPVVQMHARNLIVAATITTVLFNLNPLMRFDGYYLLSDYLELPNLSTNATRWLTYLRQKYWLGASVTRPTWPEGQVPMVATYAVAAFVWRILICVTLAMAAMSLWRGAGILLAAVAITFWIGKPIVRLFAHWNDPVRINRSRFLTVTGAMVVLCIAGLMLPYQQRVSAPMIVTHDKPVEVRSRARGFVTEIAVEPGQRVVVGQVLARLTNRGLEIDLQRLNAEIAQSRHRQRVFRHNQSMVELEIERASELAMMTRQHDLQQRLAGLHIRCPAEGTVLQSDLVDRLGTLVTAGERMFVVADPKQMKLVAMIRQDDAVTLRDRDQFTADVWIEGQGRLLETICFDELKPRATHDLSHPAFASSLGGSLAVYANPQARNVKERWKLVEPRVIAEAFWEDPQSQNGGGELRGGQRGTVRFVLGQQTLGQILLDELIQWYRKSGASVVIAAR
ncbi:efflux RND transporter periplasmic adaptor subunit [Novipirellula artificiosorum]|uniref:HlyD family secretion protein n=1 Tax=Novipirellula artificiosorum TaxID=2528016 RepID=A0A5C6D8D8_9BACT|nr:efflux RND transporter periplasmic adaptor subunit [Novipirellula artificiosorum]TWU31967.1 HlyD family secretion protein [Novipirellula artificiosorum]